jgi:hypothetical protein
VPVSLSLLVLPATIRSSLSAEETFIPEPLGQRGSKYYNSKQKSAILQTVNWRKFMSNLANYIICLTPTINEQ